MNRLEERRQIAAKIDAEKAVREAVNEQPDVIAARAECHAAQEALNAARERFNAIFRRHCPNDGELVSDLVDAHPDLFVLGDVDYGAVCVARCSVTGLPLFVGDKVIECRMGDEFYERTFVLAEAVQVDASVSLLEPHEIVAGDSYSDEDGEDEDDGEEAA